ncbi:MAG TPA: SAM-dependent methyltransferase [Streptosporangiaceae bacterium]|nr:SAM-dependent methyltransferase [Streptosporangiaceae bacterium]
MTTDETSVTAQHGTSAASSEERPTFDTSVAHIARVYDYWLGGKDNYAADRKAGDAALEAYPYIAAGVRANRAFLARVVRFLAGEAGIRQFLDIGTGIPTANNTHEVAQAVAPDSRVVYVDNDPIVLAHARALLTSTREGATSYLEADFRDIGTILADAGQTLDFSQPVAIMLIAILHLVDDDADPHRTVAKLVDVVPSGSYLAISHLSSDIMASAARTEAHDRLRQLMHERQTLRNREEVASFFAGLEMVEPGLVPITQWRPDYEAQAKSPTALWGGVARKP